MTEESLADWLELERRKQNGDIVTWNIKFFVGNFFIWIRGGEETDAPGYHEHISQCENVEVRLYDRKDGEPPPVWAPEEAEKIFDVHHIVDRNELPNGGYVLENGITLCHADHEKAEHYHSTGVALPGFSIQELYEKIGSSLEKAIISANKLK